MRKPLLLSLIAVAAVLAFVVGIFVVGPLLVPVRVADTPPALEPSPPLEPITRVSVVVAPAAIALPAIQSALDAAAPRTLNGKQDNPVAGLLSKADIGWTVQRGAVSVTGKEGALTVASPFTGTFHITGQLGGQIGNLGGAIGNLLGGSIGQQVQSLAGKPFDQSAELRGDVTVTARPALTPQWRLDPNLTAQVSLGNSALSVGGIRVNVPDQVKPYIDRSVADEVAALQQRLRNDPFLEVAARREWAQLCRAVPLAPPSGATAGAPNLWLEVRPLRAFAAQPSIDANAVNLQVGVQAETRVVPNETKPDCPFPAQLQIVPQLRQGQIHVAMPIDVPFPEVNRLLEAQLKGHTYPEDGSGSTQVTIRSVNVAPSGKRLLISLGVNVREKKLFSFGADAVVHIWGVPQLDVEHQILRLSDVTVDVNSQAAFGLLGAAAKAATPYLTQLVADKAVVDLKPFAADARKRIVASVAAIASQNGNVHVGTSLSDLRLVGLGFDSHILRLVSEADGSLDVAVTSLAPPAGSTP